MALLAAFVLLLFCYSLVSRRLERTIVTAPIVFAAAGMLVGSVTPAVIGPAFGRDAFLRLAEIGLVLLLFTDASRTNLNVLRNIRSLPMRLLSAGMLLTIVLGAVAALIVFPQLSIWEAGSSLPFSRRPMPASDRSSSTARACRCVSARPSTWKPVSMTDFRCRSSCFSSPWPQPGAKMALQA